MVFNTQLNSLHKNGETWHRMRAPKKVIINDIRTRRKKANVEYRITNIECRRNVFYLFYKKMERSDSTLRNSAVRYSIFCGSLFTHYVANLMILATSNI
jgi:hypothetical protein